MNWKSHLKTAAIFALTLVFVAAVAEAFGVWNWVFHPYASATGKSS